MSILIIAEHNNAVLASSNLNTVTAALQLNDSDIHVLVAGHQCQAVAEEAAKMTGVSKVILADQAAYEYMLAENITQLVQEVAGSGYDYILATASTTGKNILPRIAAMLDVEPISDVIAIESPTQFKRPIYAGNAIATVTSSAPVKIMTIRPTGFDAATTEGSASVETVDHACDMNISLFVKQELVESDRPELGDASVVISGGRGLQNAENFKMLDGIADKLGAAIGASRAAVDAGYVANDRQVGQTGKIVAPSLYIAVGISGAIQHLAGMKDSKVIVAINKDPEAPIFQVADYGLVADLFEVLPELEQKLP